MLLPKIIRGLAAGLIFIFLIIGILSYFNGMLGLLIAIFIIPILCTAVLPIWALSHLLALRRKYLPDSTSADDSAIIIQPTNAEAVESTPDSTETDDRLAVIDTRLTILSIMIIASIVIWSLIWFIFGELLGGWLTIVASTIYLVTIFYSFFVLVSRE